MKNRKTLRTLALAIILLMPVLLFFTADVNKVKAQIIEQQPPPPKIETKFTVYPDGWVLIGALVNQSLPPPTPYAVPPPTGYATLKFWWDRVLKTSVNSVYILPKEGMKEFPLNSTELSIHTKKFADTVTSELNATVTMPSAVKSAFPFNMTDLSLVSDYRAGTADGNLTIIVAGYPLSAIDFSGNRTQISLNGTAIIPFLTFPGVTINRTMVIQALNYIIVNFTGRGPYSLWTASGGLMECVSFSNITTFADGYASVSFEMQIKGDVVSLLSKWLVKVMYWPTRVFFGYPYRPYPPEMEMAFESLMYKALNSTFNSVQKGIVQLVYTYSDGKLVYKEKTTFTITDLTKDLMDIITSIPNMPPSLKALIEALLGKMYASIKTAEVSTTYSLIGEFVKIGKIAFALDITFEGDLNEELNYIKAKVLSYYLSTLPTWVPIPWQLTIMNETLLDIGRLTLSFNVTTASVIFGWENLRIQPPRDVVNATQFRLKRFFNLTNPAPGPSTNEPSMKITVEGGNNVTHSVSLYRPATVPAPTTTTDSKMIWDNARISSIQDLTFNIKQVITVPVVGKTILNPSLVTAANPATVDASEVANTILTITNISAPATIVVGGKTEAPGVESAPSGFSLLGNYVEIIASEEVEVQATIRISYTDEQLAASGLDEGSLKIYYWNEASEEWVAVETTVNADENYATADVTSFSVWGLFGQPAPFWTKWWFYLIIVIVVAVGVGVFMVMRKRKKPMPPTAPTPTTTVSTKLITTD